MISKVKATNFLSWSSLEFDLESGVTLIDGWNEDDQTPEGSGKSAILNAICWSLYGKLPKDANIDDVIKEGEKACEVEVWFDDNFIVKRSRKPNALSLMEHVGDQWVERKGKDAKETQTIVEDFLALSFETFCQTVYFAQNYPKKFITSNQEEKGKILSEVQDLGLFDKALREVKELIKLEESALIKLTNSGILRSKDVELIKLNIISEENKFEHAQEMQRTRAESLQRQLEGALATVDTEETYVNDLKNEIRDLTYDPTLGEELNAALQEASTKIGSINSDLRGIDSLISKKINAETQGKRYAERYKKIQSEKENNLRFIENPSKNCPTCGTELSNCDTSHAQEEIKRLDAELESITQTLEIFSEEIDREIPTKEALNRILVDLKKSKAEIESEIGKILEVKSRISSCKKLISDAEFQLANGLERVKKLTDGLALETKPLSFDHSALHNFKSQLTDLEEEIKDINIVVNSKRTHLSQLEELKVGFKEVKSHIFNSVLNELNARVSSYLNTLFEVPVTVIFKNEDMKIETEVKYDGSDRGLGLLSGGQFRRVSLAVDLALSDVITARKGSRAGILVLDEYFKDLSESSMEKCLTLLEGRNQPVLLVEHNSIFKNIVTNTVQVRLEKGTSRVEA